MQDLSDSPSFEIQPNPDIYELLRNLEHMMITQINENIFKIFCIICVTISAYTFCVFLFLRSSIFYGNTTINKLITYVTEFCTLFLILAYFTLLLYALTFLWDMWENAPPSHIMSWFAVLFLSFCGFVGEMIVMNRLVWVTVPPNPNTDSAVTMIALATSAIMFMMSLMLLWIFPIPRSNIWDMFV